MGNLKTGQTCYRADLALPDGYKCLSAKTDCSHIQTDVPDEWTCHIWQRWPYDAIVARNEGCVPPTQFRGPGRLKKCLALWQNVFSFSLSLNDWQVHFAVVTPRFTRRRDNKPNVIEHKSVSLKTLSAGGGCSSMLGCFCQDFSDSQDTCEHAL